MSVFHPVQRDRAPNHLPESVVLRAYEVYVALYGPQAALIDVAQGCRGGFSINEVIGFLYARTFPRDEWMQRFKESLERSSQGGIRRPDPPVDAALASSGSQP